MILFIIKKFYLDLNDKISFVFFSSRFTDSKKYESDFGDCFHLLEQRTGQICNACVLLVKRWKKLPNRLDRNWNHVSDKFVTIFM